MKRVIEYVLLIVGILAVLIVFVIKQSHFISKKKNYSSMRSVSLMSEPAYRFFRIINNKLCSINKKDFMVDNYCKPRAHYTSTFKCNCIVDIYKTTNILSKYERTRVLTERAQQIEGGATPYITNIERFNSSYAIAVEELNMKKIPYIIRRSMPHVGIYEYWKLKDMII